MQSPSPTAAARSVPIEPFDVRGSFDTPCLLVDDIRVEQNVARMAKRIRERGVSLRPHTKTHKTVEVAHLQILSGAVGLTVGTLGEAEVFAEVRLYRDLFVGYPVPPTSAKVERLRALLDAVDLSIGVDSVDAAREWARALGRHATRLAVLVEVDSGLRRTGVAPPDAGAVARVVAEAGLRVRGVFTHGGHSYAPGASEAAARDERQALGAAAEAMRAEGIEPEVVSAGSTPTAIFAADSPVTEVRPGTYVFNDRQQVALGSAAPDDVALLVATTVVSDAVPGQVVVDAGAKTLTKDRASWLEGYGEVLGYPGTVIERLNDYHGIVRFPEGVERPVPGSTLLIAPNHVCPVVDLADSMFLLLGGAKVNVWPVDARGRSA